MKAGIQPLIYRGATDPDRVKAGLSGPGNPISHFTQMAHANTEKVNSQFEGSRPTEYFYYLIDNYIHYR